MTGQRCTTRQPDLFRHRLALRLDPDQRKAAALALEQLMTAVVRDGEAAPEETDDDEV